MQKKDETTLLYKELIGGAQGRNRTTDTVIFSHVLYQLSYLGSRRRRNAGAAETYGHIGVPGALCPAPAYSGGNRPSQDDSQSMRDLSLSIGMSMARALSIANPPSIAN
jgi:hypothetical protein